MISCRAKVQYVVTVCMLFMSMGCGGGARGPKAVPVSGQVYLDGKLLDGAEIRFISEKFTGFGKTKSDGRYTLAQGALPGLNKVYITKKTGDQEINGDPNSGRDKGQSEAESAAVVGTPAEAKTPKDLIPAEFSDPAKSKLTFEVPAAGTNAADFRL